MTLPYGIFSYGISSPRVGVLVTRNDFPGNAFPDQAILDLEVIGLLGHFDGLPLDPAVFAKPILNDFMALGKPIWTAVRQRLIDLLSQPDSPLEAIREQAFIHQSRATMHLPVRVGDYTDFYAGIEHARNVGKMFRPDGDPLLPNYRHMPIAYHGRASSIVVSGTPIRRPSGQSLGADGQPQFGPSKSLDIELELGLIIGQKSTLGEPVSIDKAEDYIFGIVLFNDWSARDIQRWEYQPLGPFLGKNFGSSISAWVVPFEAFEPFRVTGETQEPTPLPYLQQTSADLTRPAHFDINLEVELNGSVVSQTNARHLYWSFAQMIAHHTVNGCNLCVGDILATGTISGPEPGTYGSFLELTWSGKNPISLPDGTSRTFLQDGDVVTLRGRAGDVELGEVSGKIV